jgi:hypothetical protein
MEASGGGQRDAPTEGQPDPREKQTVTPSRSGRLRAALSRTIPGWRSYGAALFLTGALIPAATTVITVALYAASGGRNRAVPLTALLVGLLVWLLVTRAISISATAEGANPREFRDLLIRQEHDRMKVQSLSTTSLQPDPGEVAPTIEEIAMRIRGLQEGAAHLDAFLQESKQRGIIWLLGSGYLNLWARVYAAEEALIEADYAPSVVAGAANDELRLMGSDISHADALLQKLRVAVGVLSPEGSALLAAPVRVQSPSLAEARAMLRQIRQAINEFREGAWDGLRRTSTLTLITLGVGWMVTYILIALVVVAQVRPRAIVTAAAFFLVAAVTGMLYLLHVDAQSDHVVEDFGLSVVRVLAQPLYSGLAGVIGILVAAALHISVGGVSLGSPAGAQSAGGLLWFQVFDWNQNGSGFALAAILGLAPGVLIDYLQKAGDQLKNSLKSTEATGSTK